MEDSIIKDTVETYMSRLGSRLEEQELELFEFLLEAVVKLSLESGNWGIQNVIEQVLDVHEEVTREDMQNLIVKISEESELMEVLGRF